MGIDAKLVFKLRQATSAGMMDCKKALEATNGNWDDAIQWLKEKGVAKAIKKTNREAKEGLVLAKKLNDHAAIIELNCETDFVARNEKFVDLANKILDIILENKALDTKTALGLKIGNDTVENYILGQSATLGEKFQLSNVTYIEVPNNGCLGFYNHPNGRVSAIVGIEGSTNEEAARNVAMHLSAMNPTYLDRNSINAEELKKEEETLLNMALEENKTAAKPVNEEIIAKKVQGRLGKILSEKCLVEQSYVKEPNLTVSKYLAITNSKAVLMVRFELNK